MIMHMRHKLIGWLCRACLLLTLFVPAAAFAKNDEPQREPIDARYEGYGDTGQRQAPLNVTLDSHSTGVVWILTVFLGLLVFAGLFKDAKRSHLD